jgi:hypothetical protein
VTHRDRGAEKEREGRGERERESEGGRRILHKREIQQLAQFLCNRSMSSVLSHLHVPARMMIAPF